MAEHTLAHRAAGLAMLGGAALLSGCMNLIPAYERPAQPVPQAYAPELVAAHHERPVAVSIGLQPAPPALAYQSRAPPFAPV